MVAHASMLQLLQDNESSAPNRCAGVGGARILASARGHLERSAVALGLFHPSSSICDVQPILPVLRRLSRERVQIARVHKGLAKATYLLPRQAEAPVGFDALERLAAGSAD